MTPIANWDTLFAVRGIPLGLCLMTGCLYGGGPVVGARLQRTPKLVVGGEVGAGIAFVKLDVGVERSGIGYGRLDAVLDAIGFGSSHTPGNVGGLLGVGYGGGGGDHGGVMAAGVDTGFILARDGDCSHSKPVVHVGIDLRYVRGWELILAPRLEGHLDICTH